MNSQMYQSQHQGFRVTSRHLMRIGGERIQRLRESLGEEAGQGTTEYAILVGVLVVIAIMAIVLFRDKVQELWTAIADGINGL